MTKRSPIPATLVALGALALLVPPGAALALRAPDGLDALAAPDLEALETLATYPEPLREAALRASRNVDLLVEMQRIQAQSSEAFRERVGRQEEALQERIWELVRAPGLLAELGSGGPRSGRELDEIAGRHPAELEPAIRQLGRGHYGLLAEILRIDRVAQDRFEVLLEWESEETRQALHDLVGEPELLSLLASRVRLAVHLGDSFREAPDATRAYLAAVERDVAERNESARDAWMDGIARDSDASADLESSARAYASEYGYDYDELTEVRTGTSIQVVVNPDPYWLGYPVGYADAHLYPHGYWRPHRPNLGYSHGHRVYFGLPSGHFLHWLFAKQRHHRYRHLSDRFARYSDTHRNTRGHFHSTVRHWAEGRDRPQHRDEGTARARRAPRREPRHVRRSRSARQEREQVRERPQHGEARSGGGEQQQTRREKKSGRARRAQARRLKEVDGAAVGGRSRRL